MKPQGARRNLAGERSPDHVNGKNAAPVFELVQKWTTRSCLQPGTVVIRGIVITDCRVPATHRKVEVIVLGILYKIALQVHTERVVRTCLNSVDGVRSAFENDLTQKLEAIRDIRRYEEIELPQRERCRVSTLGVSVQRYVTKTADSQKRLGDVHPLHLAVHAAFLL